MYRACGRGCRQTCDSRSCDLSQVDGCFCPDGQVSGVSHHWEFRFAEKISHSYFTLFLLDFWHYELSVHLILKMREQIFSINSKVCTLVFLLILHNLLIEMILYFLCHKLFKAILLFIWVTLIDWFFNSYFHTPLFFHHHCCSFAAHRLQVSAQKFITKTYLFQTAHQCSEYFTKRYVYN